MSGGANFDEKRHVNLQARWQPWNWLRSTSSCGDEGPTAQGRLGKRELGRYANEERMPNYLYKLLSKKPYLGTAHLHFIPVLAQLCKLAPTVTNAYLCHPCVQHIGKLSWREGNTFCGYHNIQMLITWVTAHIDIKYQVFSHRGVPGILELQEMIEFAWWLGIDREAKEQIGGIKGTRKYIGTAEARALFHSVGVYCTAAVFSSGKVTEPAYEELLDFVQEYFSDGSPNTEPIQAGKVHNTTLAPIYLQRPGHSMTIVGLVVNDDGSRDLLVFDPAFSPSRTMKALAQDPSKVKEKRAEALLKDYRRGAKELEQFPGFETLRLTGQLERRLERWEMSCF